MVIHGAKKDTLFGAWYLDRSEFLSPKVAFSRKCVSFLRAHAVLRSFHDPHYDGEFARFSEQLLEHEDGGFSEKREGVGRRLDILRDARASWRLRRHDYQGRLV